MDFPRQLPGFPSIADVADQVFEVQRMDYGAPEQSGRMAGIQAGFPLWMATYTIGPMDEATDVAEWRAALRWLRGQQRLFYARDVLRDFPFYYPTGFAGMNRAAGGAFPSNGGATSWSVDSTRTLLTINGLPASFTFHTDDHIGFSWVTSSEPRAALVAVDHGASADGSGVVTVPVEPPVPTVVPGGAACYLQTPFVIMRRVGLQMTDPGVGKRDGVSMGQFTLTGIQDLRA